MRKIFFVLVIVSAVGTLAGCKKDNIGGGGGDGGSSPRVRSIITDGDSVWYEYDVDGRITKSTEGKTMVGTYYNSVINYEYSANKVLVKYLLATGDSYTYLYMLDGNGLATSLGRPDSVPSELYYYNGDGYLVKDKNGYNANYGFYAYQDSFTIFGGNIMSRTATFGVKESYTYNDKPNTFGNENRGQAFLGRQSKNLVATHHYEQNSSKEDYTYTYEYDAQGRVTSYLESYANSSSTTAYTITYY